MNTDTIRTGLENALHSLDCELSGFERSDDEYLEIQIPHDAKCTCGLDDALAELDKAPKALTDEEIEKLRLSREREDGRRASSKYGYGFADGLRYARDSGYLAPSAGLTVEEDAINQIIKAGDSIASEVESRQSTERMMSEQFDLSKDQRDSHAIRAERMRRRLAAWTSAKSRLTAKLNSKNNVH